MRKKTRAHKVSRKKAAPKQDVAPAAPPAISSVPVPSTTVEEPAATPAVASDKKPATPLLPPPGPLVLTVRVRHWWFKVPDKEILLASGSHCFAVATTDKSGIVRFEHLSPGRYSIAVASGHVCEKMIDLKNSSTAGFFI